MFVIAIFALVAALGFRKVLRQKGYFMSRLWAYPLLIGSAMCLVQFVLGTFAGMIAKDKHAAVAQAYPAFVALLSILMMFALVAIAWKQIKAMPPAKDAPPGE